MCISYTMIDRIRQNILAISESKNFEGRAVNWTEQKTPAFGKKDTYESFLWPKKARVIKDHIDSLRRDKEKLSGVISYLDLFSGLGFAAREIGEKLNSEATDNPMPYQSLNVDISDRRTPEQKEADSSNGVHFLVGNLMKRSTWNEIKDICGEDFEGFDLITACPIGGFPLVSPEIFFSMLDRATRLLHPNSGLLLFQIFDHLVYNPLYRDTTLSMLDELKASGEITDYWESEMKGAVMIRKRNDSLRQKIRRFFS